MNNRIIIYTLSDPITNEVRYVGKTKGTLNGRLACHLLDPLKCHRTNWFKSLARKGLKPIIEELVVATDETWSEEESFYISYFKYLGLRLTNMTTGGESGEMSLDAKKKISKNNKGLKRTDATKEKIRVLNELGVIGMKGKTHNKETKSKISASLTGKKHSEERRMNISAGNERRKKPVLQIDKNGVVVKEWSSISEVANTTGFCKGHIIKCCKGAIDKEGYQIKTSYGYRWSYK